MVTFVCLSCREVVSPSEYCGEKIHVCSPFSYDKAVAVEGHNCSDYQECVYTEAGPLVSRCAICKITGDANGN